MSELLDAARLWPAVVLGGASAALVWLLGLGRLRGGMAVGGALAGLFLAGQWPAATVGIGAFVLAGVLGRLAESASGDDPSVGRLTLRAVAGISAPAVLLAFAAAIAGTSATLWLAAIAALAGGAAVWSASMLRAARPDVTGLGYAVAGGMALALAGLAHGQQLIAPGAGAGIIVAVVSALALVSRGIASPAAQAAAGAVISALLAASVDLLLP